MAHASQHYDVVPPKELKIAPIYFTISIVLIIIGAIGFAAGLFGNPVRAWQGYLIGFWFTFSLALAGPFIMAVQFLSKAGWGVSFRRVPEALGTFLYIASPLAIIALIGAPSLFGYGHGWLSEAAATDPITLQKTGFLNMTGLVLVTVIGPALVATLHFLMRRNSLRQDVDKDPKHSHQNMLLSAGFILSFVLSLSFMTWYWIMSLDPHWFSTMFQVYTFAGLFQSGVALVAIVVIVLRNRGYFGSAVGTEHIHDLGKFVFAFTVFYAYIAFSQFMLIWYANIAEETVWFAMRFTNGWGPFSLVLPFVKFILPFVILLPAAHKKNKNNILFYICWLILATQLYEVWYWVTPYLVDPVTHAFSGPNFPIYELPIALGFIGMLMLVCGRALQAHSLVPIHDPLLHESLPHVDEDYEAAFNELQTKSRSIVHES